MKTFRLNNNNKVLLVKRCRGALDNVSRRGVSTKVNAVSGSHAAIEISVVGKRGTLSESFILANLDDSGLNDIKQMYGIDDVYDSFENTDVDIDDSNLWVVYSQGKVYSLNSFAELTSIASRIVQKLSNITGKI